MLAGSAASAGGSIFGGTSQKKAAEREADQVRLSTIANVDESRKKSRRILAEQRSRYGYSGLDMEGSPLLVQMESVSEAEDEVNRIMATGRMKEKALKAQGKDAMTSGILSAFGGAAQGASSFIGAGQKSNWWS
jgi:hypothetical protein